MSKAVTKVFVELYNKKLIYKDKKLINWDTKLRTAISDLDNIFKVFLWFKKPISLCCL